MTKLLLWGTTALALLTATTGFAAETPDSIRAALNRLVEGQPLLETVIDTNQLQIVPEGDDFVLTLPASPDKPGTPARTVRLVADGLFNGQNQYRIDGFFDTVLNVVSDFAPVAVTGEKSASQLTWVPHYNLISKSSQNIQNLKLDIPPYAQVSVGRIVTDSLTQAQGTDRLDQAASQDITNLTISTQGMTLTVPSISYQGSVQNAPLSADTMAQVLLADQTSSQITIPTLMITQSQGTSPLATLAFAASGSYRDNVFHLKARLDKITLDSTLRSLLPITVLPTEVTLDADISGPADEEFKKQLVALQTDDTPESRAALQAVLAEWGDNITLRINRLEMKESDAGILVQGTLKNQDNTPDMDLTVTITNLDKISPPPAIDQAQCDEARKQLAAIDPTAPEAATQKTVADFVVAQACSPRGGFLDDLRPYLNERTADGKDVIKVLLQDGALTVNGKVVGTVPGSDADEAVNAIGPSDEPDADVPDNAVFQDVP